MKDLQYPWKWTALVLILAGAGGVLSGFMQSGSFPFDSAKQERRVLPDTVLEACREPSVLSPHTTPKGAGGISDPLIPPASEVSDHNQGELAAYVACLRSHGFGL